MDQIVSACLRDVSHRHLSVQQKAYPLPQIMLPQDIEMRNTQLLERTRQGQSNHCDGSRKTGDYQGEAEPNVQRSSG